MTKPGVVSNFDLVLQQARKDSAALKARGIDLDKLDEEVHDFIENHDTDEITPLLFRNALGKVL